MRDVLKTKRLVLRPLIQTDWKALVNNAGNINVAKATGSLPHPYSYADAINWISLTNSPEFSGYFYGIANSDNQIIGCIGLSPSSDRLELGYWLAEDQWNKGFMSEAVSAVLIELSRSSSAVLVTAHVFTDNHFSAKVLEHAGFKQKKTTSKFCLARGHNVQSLEFYRYVGGSDA